MRLNKMNVIDVDIQIKKELKGSKMLEYYIASTSDVLTRYKEIIDEYLTLASHFSKETVARSRKPIKKTYLGLSRLRKRDD
jgi:hypothetical protein